LPSATHHMRTLNYVLSVISIILGLALVFFVLTQTEHWDFVTTFDVRKWSIGTAIGVVLILNGAIRLWFAQDDN
jgi:hypothetical protein